MARVAAAGRVVLSAVNLRQPTIGPREDDNWDDCISDDGVYHLAGESAPSSIARVASFETIADLLWRADSAPSAQAFLDARIEYSIDQGLDSRVSRRYDARL